VAYARPSADIPGTVQVQAVVEKALIFCEHELKGSPIQILREFDARLPPVRGMAGQLTQVFVNLFTNAAHAMASEGGELRIGMHANVDQHTLTVEVADSGIGIDEQDMPQIFEPFFTTKSEGRGTGLGLSIVRGIVSGITTEFWNSCDAVCKFDHWTLWGTPNCGKGQPMQTMGTGHGASPARFRNVHIGTAFSNQ